MFVPSRGIRGGVLAVATIFLATLAQPPTATGADSASSRRAAMSQVFIVQGVPQTNVSVTIDGKAVLSDLPAKAVSSPLALARGSHSVTFESRGGWKISSTFSIKARSVDVVLHWPADKTDTPEVTVYDNDLKPLAVDKARLSIAHTAVVPPADVRVDRKVLFANIANGEFVSADVPAGTYSVDIVPAGESGTALFGPVDLPVKANSLTRVFAIGQPKDNSMDAIVQNLPLRTTGSPAPDSVNAGSAGLAGALFGWTTGGQVNGSDQTGPTAAESVAGVVSLFVLVVFAGLMSIRVGRRSSRAPRGG